jgi:hypothetical protein
LHFKLQPIWPLLKGADEQPIPSWGFIQRTVQFQGKFFTSSFLQAAVAGSILGIDFLRKIKVKIVPETSYVLFACTAAASSVSPRLSSSVPEAVPPFAWPTSSQPPAISTQLVRIPEVKSSSFNIRNDQSLLDLSPSVQVIPDIVPTDVKLLLQKHSSILRTGDVLPKPTQGVEHHIHTGSHPPVFAKARRLDPQKLEITKAEFKKVRIHWHHSSFKITMGLAFAHGAQKRWIMAVLRRLSPSQYDYYP